MKDGAPQSAPVWIAREGELITIATEDGSLKGKNTARDPRVAISIVDFVDPYEEVQIQGRVIERRRDADLKVYDAMSRKYVGRDWPYRDEEGPIVLVIEVLKEKYSKQPFEHGLRAR
jgi:Pyridoxamine 5'-phosphate oxidase